MLLPFINTKVVVIRDDLFKGRIRYMGYITQLIQIKEMIRICTSSFEVVFLKDDLSQKLYKI